MVKLAKQRVLHVWIALLAMLFGALAPVASEAVASARPALPAMEICSMNGAQPMAPAKQGGAHGAIDHLLKHCSSCVTHGHAPALPPSAPLAFTAVPLRDGHPALFYQAARPLFPWTAFHPRAPPARI
ncbi:Protein of unknown function (DUF2946) [Pseudoduganella flava]|uniref:DUF2946 domain-containing protein n=1 Tax=Pseudoduganella flava TaxID=871742 RepID=A0A562PDL1_9BURK|nr:DUF2946 domain-containing protein [Pseudoduganella flava]QGZ42107.1 DUF2946 domain-containing protein [Pseudoduganella flava]TWI42524.1 Protein of unknown function (DUF2946) [Pseudoduganella flava]